MFLLIRLCGAQADATSLVSYVGLIQQSRGTYIYRRVVRKANSDMSRSSQGLPIFTVGKSIHSEIVKQTVYYGKLVYEANRSSTFLPCVCGQLAD